MLEDGLLPMNEEYVFRLDAARRLAVQSFRDARELELIRVQAGSQVVWLSLDEAAQLAVSLKCLVEARRDYLNGIRTGKGASAPTSSSTSSLGSGYPNPVSTVNGPIENRG